MAETSTDASVAQLTAQLGVQAATLAGREIALAKAELRASARQAVRGGIPLLAAALLGGSAWLALLAAAIIGVSVAVPPWAAALVVAAFLGLLAGALAVFGGSRLDRIPAGLPLTAESIRQSVRELTHRARRS
jgi:hypothetical protein